MRRLLIVASLAIGIGVVIAIVPGHRGWFDISVYQGAMRYWSSGGDLYSYLRPRSTYGFTYPPFAAVCMLPMALVGWHPAIAINLALTVAASALLVWLLIDPIARRDGWSRWYAFGLAACAFAALNPVRDTVSFGQINLLLVALVYLDLWLLTQAPRLRSDGGRLAGVRRLVSVGRLAGVGIGLAAAIKLTPAVFLLYLLIARKWRAFWTALGTALGATLLAAALAPDASRAYFTDAVWNTSRIGRLDYVSNQSLLGFVSRMHGSHVLWVILVVAVLAVWAWRCRHVDDPVVGFALTGAVSCLISPITWVHHLVWLVPGLALFLHRRRPVGIGCYAILISGVVWLWSANPSLGGTMIAFFGANAYVVVTLAVLAVAPASPADWPASSVPASPRSRRPAAPRGEPSVPAGSAATPPPPAERVGAAGR